MMTKKIKIAITLALSLTLFISCSTDSIDSQNDASNLSLKEKLAPTKKGLNSRVDGWKPGDDSNEPPIDDTPPTDDTVIFHLSIEYVPGLSPAQKSALRLEYQDYVGLISHEPCLDDTKEIWTVDYDIYSCPTCGKPKAEAVEADSDIEKAIESADCE